MPYVEAGRAAMHGRLTSGLASGVALALGLVAFLPLAHAGAAIPLGVDMDAVEEVAAAGAPAHYGSFWVGRWMLSSGWNGLDDALRVATRTNTVPVIYWYYWGDSISPACVERGCDGRSFDEWMRMTQTLADHLRRAMGGREVLVVLENEFNKGGITDAYASTFDAHLETVAEKLKTVDGVRIVLGFGAWAESSWSKFPKAAAASDFIGFQLMRASTRDTEAQYRGAADRAVALADHVEGTFGKPSFLYDLALSSYPDANWERIQGETLAAVLTAVAGAGGHGIAGAVYRTLVDNPHMSEKNYFGPAEKSWGLKRADGSGEKPAWAAWVAATGGR